MAAPSGIVWGSIVGSYGRIGIYVNATTSNTIVSGTIEIWFWSKYSVTDSGNNLYYDNRSSSGSATTPAASGINIKHTVATGEGWSTSNQTKLKSYSFSYNRGTSASTRYLYAKFADVDRVGGTMYANTTISIPKLSSYTISYNANGGSGAPGSQTKWYGKALTLSSTKPTRTGHSFQRWNTRSDGEGVDYNSGGTYNANSAATLYAVWEANKYTIQYNANGGTGAPTKQNKTYGSSLKLSTTKPTRENYNFKGWATTASATTATYQAGGSYTANSGATLYAVWELAYVKPRIKDAYVSRVYLDEVDGIMSSDSGINARISFSWECDRDVTSILVEWKKSGEYTWKSHEITSIAAKAGDTAVCIWADADTFAGAKEDCPEDIFISSDGFSPDVMYSIRISVTDTETSYIVQTLPADKCLIEGMPQNVGISFGKPAELEGVCDIAFQTRLLGGLLYPILEPCDLNDDELRVPNIYSGRNVKDYAYTCGGEALPFANGTFTLEVLSSGPNGQTLQRITICDKKKSRVYERWYYTNEWSEWTGGWIHPTIGSEFAVYSADGVSSAPACRKDGRLVEVRGIVKPTVDIPGSTDMHTIFTVPDGYRPSDPVYVTCQGSGSCVWLLRVNTNGTVDFSRYRSGATSTTASAGTWLPFQVTYLVE